MKRWHYLLILLLVLLACSPAALWSAVVRGTGSGAGTPGGSSGQIQYNNAGAFGGTTIGALLAAIAGNITIGDGSQAGPTITFGVTGTDPVLTITNGILNVSTGALQVGGTSVLTAVTESNLSFSDVTTANASTTQHGLMPKLGMSATFLTSTDQTSVFPNSVNVGTPLSPTDDTVAVGNGTVWENKTIPNCTDTGGNHLNYTQSTNALSCGTSSSGGGTVVWDPPQGLRLSLTTNTYITSADVTGATTLYYTPVISGGHGTVTCYNGSALERQSIQQKSLATPTLTAATPYDIFLDCVNGDLEALAWTNGTTRATALANQNGAVVKSGDVTKLYLGTIYPSATDTMEDSAAKRFVWNMYNRVPTSLYKTDTTNSWTYGTATWRQANGSAANQVEVITGLAGLRITVDYSAVVSTTSSDIQLGVGVNSTTVASGTVSYASNASMQIGLHAYYVGAVALGYSYFAALEIATSGLTSTVYGDNNTTNAWMGIAASWER